MIQLQVAAVALQSRPHMSDAKIFGINSRKAPNDKQRGGNAMAVMKKMDKLCLISTAFFFLLTSSAHSMVDPPIRGNSVSRFPNVPKCSQCAQLRILHSLINGEDEACCLCCSIQSTLLDQNRLPNVALEGITDLAWTSHEHPNIHQKHHGASGFRIHCD